MTRDSSEELSADWRQFLNDDILAVCENCSLSEPISALGESGHIHRGLGNAPLDFAGFQPYDKVVKDMSSVTLVGQDAFLNFSQPHPLLRRDSVEQVRQFDLGAAAMDQIFGSRLVSARCLVDDAQQIVDVRPQSSCSDGFERIEEVEDEDMQEAPGTPETWAHQTKRRSVNIKPTAIMDDPESLARKTSTNQPTTELVLNFSDSKRDKLVLNTKRRRVSTAFFDTDTPQGARSRRGSAEFLPATSSVVKTEEEQEEEREEREEVEKQVQEALAAGYQGPICAYELCPAPMHSSGTWKTVTAETTAGGQEWSTMIGKTYCHACWTQYRTKGTLARKHRREINVIDTPEEVRKRYRRRTVAKEDSNEDSS